MSACYVCSLMGRSECVPLLPTQPVASLSAGESLSSRLLLILGDFSTLIEAKDEKDAHGESERYHELKRNAWGNARVSCRHLADLIRGVEALESGSILVTADTTPRAVAGVRWDAFGCPVAGEVIEENRRAARSELGD